MSPPTSHPHQHERSGTAPPPVFFALLFSKPLWITQMLREGGGLLGIEMASGWGPGVFHLVSKQRTVSPPRRPGLFVLNCSYS